MCCPVLLYIDHLVDFIVGKYTYCLCFALRWSLVSGKEGTRCGVGGRHLRFHVKSVHSCDLFPSSLVMVGGSLHPMVKWWASCRVLLGVRLDPWKNPNRTPILSRDTLSNFRSWPTKNVRQSELFKQPFPEDMAGWSQRSRSSAGLVWPGVACLWSGVEGTGGWPSEPWLLGRMRVQELLYQQSHTLESQHPGSMCHC